VTIGDATAGRVHCAFEDTGYGHGIERECLRISEQRTGRGGRQMTCQSAWIQTGKSNEMPMIKERTKHARCAKNIQSSLFRLNLRIQCHVFSIYIDGFSTLILKSQDRKTLLERLSKHNELTGSGRTRIPCGRTGQMRWTIF
jgi:hypothetical protein